MKTALVIENSELMREVIKDLLAENGLKTIGEATDVNDAVGEYVRLKPDLVTLDIMMPGGSGVDVLKSIMTKDPKAKVLVITEFGRDAIDRQVQRIGAQAVIHKPIVAHELKATLEHIKAGTPIPVEGAAAPAKVKAVVVDDSLVMRSMVKDILRECGVEVIGEAPDVQPAIETYKRLKPDLMVLDLVMPGGSGMDVLKAVKAINPKVKVMIVTSVAQEKLSKELMDAGAGAIVHKPFTPEEIRAGLEKVVSVKAPEPRDLGALPPAQLGALEKLFRASGENCAQAMAKLCNSPWELGDVKVYSGDSPDFVDVKRRIWSMKAIPVEITVKKTLLIVGLIVASKASAEKITKLIARNERQINDEIVKSVLMEWTNILITAVLNAFANSMGNIIVSSTPRILDWQSEDIIGKVSKELSDIPERIIVAHSQFAGKALGADCETMFFLRADYIPNLLRK